ncbi:MAG: thioredoxin family protein, partial [Bdellovibrionales bacterium]|nr:thioredoxin family protein [Bdellovibrionales bacterium]
TLQVFKAEVTPAKTCDLNYKIYVCDDANTYCLPKEGTFNCITNVSLENKINNQVVNTLKETHPTSATKTNDLFIYNQPELAIEKAKVENKPLMIDFFGSWCPPCNVLDETIFSQPSFKKYKNKMVFLKLDADMASSWSLKEKFKVKGYPTLIFLTKNEEEIYRIVGSLTPNSFSKKINYILRNKTTSIKDLVRNFEKKKTPANAWKLIEAYYNQESYQSTLDLIPFAVQKAKLTTKEQDLIQYLPFRASFSYLKKESYPHYIQFLKNSVEAFSLQETFLDKLTLLDNIATDLKDDDLNKWISLKVLNITNTLTQKKLSEDSFLSPIDILFIRADAFEKLGFKTESQFVYQQAATALETEIKKYHLDIKTNRGFNLDRVYAIYKSGDFEKADKLYKELISIYPNEFTFYYNHANVLKDLGKKEEALSEAKKAYEYSYGDNKLRAAFFTADLLKALDHKKEALKLVNEVMSTTTLPNEPNVRTHRYYQKLMSLKEELQLNSSSHN